MRFLTYFVMVFALAGCCSTPGAGYVEADRLTYEYAQPKLEEWAEMKGDLEWWAIVKDKGIAWKARIDRAAAAEEDR